MSDYLVQTPDPLGRAIRLADMEDGDVGYIGTGQIFYTGSCYYVDQGQRIYPQADTYPLRVEKIDGRLYIDPPDHLQDIQVQRSDLNPLIRYTKLLLLPDVDTRLRLEQLRWRVTELLRLLPPVWRNLIFDEFRSQ